MDGASGISFIIIVGSLRKEESTLMDEVGSFLVKLVRVLL